MKVVVSVPPEHPCLAGHFPGRPIVPGVVLLDEIFAGLGIAVTHLGSVRFSRPVRPGERIDVSLDAGRFVGRVGDEVAVQGTLSSG